MRMRNATIPLMIAIVIPTYNESKNIGPLVTEIFHFHPKARIIIVDDNSPDKTQEVVRKLQKKYKRLDLLVRTRDKGRGAAVMDGFKYVLKKYPKVEYVLEMDSDFSHKPAEISWLLDKAKKNTIVIGSRYTKGSKIEDWPLSRIILSHFANSYIRFFLGIPINDYTMGFRCYSIKALRSIDFSKIHHKGFITLSESAYILHKNGFTFLEVPITLKDRTQGKSNANFAEVLRSFAAILEIRFRKE